MSPGALGLRSLRWLVGPALAVLALAGLAVLNRGPEWSVTITRGHGFLADGRALPAGDGEAFKRALRTVRHLSTDDSTAVTLRLGNLVQFDVEPGSRIGRPTTPGRLVDNEIALTLIDGSIRVLQGPGFGGRRLTAFTPEARLEITAPLVSLHRSDSTSRVDVYDGEVRAGGRAGGLPLVVTGGKSAIIEAGAAPRSAGAISAEEKRRLAAMIGRPFVAS